MAKILVITNSCGVGDALEYHLGTYGHVVMVLTVKGFCDAVISPKFFDLIIVDECGTAGTERETADAIEGWGKPVLGLKIFVESPDFGTLCVPKDAPFHQLIAAVDQLLTP